MVKTPPNYRDWPGTPPKSPHCGNCGAYIPDRIGKSKFVKGTGTCTMFNVLVERRKVCDKWIPRNA